jgi:polar amino acid transport system substrate-binding protein
VKQLVQDFRTGEIKLVDVPPPALAPGCVLVRNAFSLVSAGTERSTVEMAQASMIGKARKRPDLVKQVFDTVKREGIVATVNKVRSRLDQWKELGYSTAGTLLEVGEGVTGFAVGDRVACAGQDYASHAEIVCVPQNLCAKIPEGIAFEHAAFTTVGAIALQGVRQADVRLGETVAVIGLGLVGQLTVQLLKASGCTVLGVDINEVACELARKCGCDAVAVNDIERVAARLTNDFGVDAVIITASTQSNEPLALAGRIVRERGRVVLVGMVGMEIPRDLYYRKELDFRLSRSYGPGRYDPLYEEKGIDYPIGYVRWTEQRNMEAFLQLRLNVGALITHTFPINDAPKAYELITGKERFVGVLLRYPTASGTLTPPVTKGGAAVPAAIVLGVIGAGNYAQGVLLPLFEANADVTLHTVCTATGVNAKKVQEKFGFASCTTNWQELVADKSINTVLVATRHDLHGRITVAALRAGKTVFCEKPLCIREEELDEIFKSGNTRLMVGFNRRFAPFAKNMDRPLVMRYRVSVAPLPKEHWINDPEIGGGRALGEVCHFVDFLHFMAHARPVSVFAQGFGAENVQVSIRFADSSVGAIDYFSVADTTLAKEHFEAFGAGKHVIVDDFRDKGQAEEIRQFVAAVKAGKPMPIAFGDIIGSTQATFAILKSMRTGQAVEL